MKGLFQPENKIFFPEEFHISKDRKTILGESIFRDILYLEYRDTEAGSNPREYNGLKKTNKEILKSLLKDHKNMFRLENFNRYKPKRGIEL